MPDTTHFASLAQTFLSDSNFTDFEIKCQGTSYLVHRVIIACHSKYFKKTLEDSHQEPAQRVLELDDNPHAIKLMIDYFYSFDYDETSHPTPKPNSLEIHAAVYIVATRYEIPALKDLAVRKFKKATTTSALRHEDPRGAIRLAYSTSSTDRFLRDLVVHYWMEFADVLTQTQGPAVILEMVREVPEFAAEVLYRMNRPIRFTATTQCWRHIPEMDRQMTVADLFQTQCFYGKLVSQHGDLQLSRDGSPPFAPTWLMDGME